MTEESGFNSLQEKEISLHKDQTGFTPALPLSLLPDGYRGFFLKSKVTGT
jgi:hypothetical protein